MFVQEVLQPMRSSIFPASAMLFGKINISPGHPKLRRTWLYSARCSLGVPWCTVVLVFSLCHASLWPFRHPSLPKSEPIGTNSLMTLGLIKNQSHWDFSTLMVENQQCLESWPLGFDGSGVAIISFLICLEGCVGNERVCKDRGSY